MSADCDSLASGYVGTAIAAAVVGVQLAEGEIGFETGLRVLFLAPEVYVPLRLAGQRYHAAEDGANAAWAAHLDQASAARAADGILAAAAGRTTLIATHDPNLAGRCDRVVSFRDGRAAQPQPAAA
jgi:ABC-type transport system involved in cytochrome bd biosynthesis fused ATPase/permease subunit